MVSRKISIGTKNYNKKKYPDPYIEQLDTDLSELIAHSTVFGYKEKQYQDMHTAQKRQI